MMFSGGGHGPSNAGPQSEGRWTTTHAAASCGVSDSPRTRCGTPSGAYTMHDSTSPTMNGRSLLHGSFVFRWKESAPCGAPEDQSAEASLVVGYEGEPSIPSSMSAAGDHPALGTARRTASGQALVTLLSGVSPRPPP